MEKLLIEPFNFQEYLICPKCKFIIENPYEIECCGTLFCYSCVHNNTSHKDICYKCNNKAQYRQNSFLKRIINQMSLKCSFGCGLSFNHLEIRKHMLTCEFREYVCNICVNNNCKFSGKKKEFLLHMIEYHEKEIVNLNDNFKNIALNQLEYENKKILNNLLLEETKEAQGMRIPHYQQSIQARTQAMNLVRLREYDQSISNSMNNSNHSYPEYPEYNSDEYLEYAT